MSLQELHRDLRLAAGIARKRPFNALLQLTNRCNMRCPFCTFWSNGAPPSQELTLEEYARLEHELAEVGCFLLSLEGGEPFVRPELLDIVQVFSRRHVTVLYTNGWYVTPENARQLFDRGLTQVGVSIDFPDADRHDRTRGPEGATARAWAAVEALRDAAPHGGRQVHVMTVLMEENRRDLERLLQQSAARGVGHNITLLATEGTRRAPGGHRPAAGVSDELQRLHARYPHFRSFRDYLAALDPFLHGGPMPTCRAGRQSFNIDHLGNVSPCIEKIDAPVGNVRKEPLRALLDKLQRAPGSDSCQACYTLCRGMSQHLGDGGSPRAWVDLSTRLRSR